MTFWQRLGFLSSACAWVGVLAFCNVGVAESAQRGAAVFYVATPTTNFDLMASRYDVFIVGDYGWRVDLLMAAKPDAQVYRYNSVSDNYVTGNSTAEHEFMEQLAAQKGWDIEDAYLHYWDDTLVTLKGETVTIPGWGGGTAATKAEARVPVYYNNLSRRAVNVSTHRGAQLNKETLIGIGIDIPFPTTSVYPTGLFLDNMGTQYWNTGIIISGGHVLETPGHLLMGSAEYQAWHWQDHWAPFLGSLKDTLEIASTWAPDGKNKKVMINISGSWNPNVPAQDVANVFFLEYQYSPMRNSGHWMEDSINWDRAAAQTGGVMFYSAKPVTSIANYEGTVTYDEALLGNYAWYLVTKTDRSLFFQQGTHDAGSPDFETLNWAGCMDVAREQFGEPLEEPRIISSGTDPRGYPYKVYAREYEGGLAVVRNRGAWNEHVDATTAVNVALPVPMFTLAPDGTVGPSVSVVSMANGRGALFVKTGEELPPGDGNGPDPVDDPEFSFRVLAISPSHGTQDVPVGTEIRWLLSDAAQVPTQSSWVSASGSFSGPIGGTLSLSGGNRLLVFSPHQPLAQGETVTVTLSFQILRHDGESLDGNGDGIPANAVADDVVVTFVVSN